MQTLQSLATVVAVALSIIPAAVAVQRDLHIANKVISPDGFTRDSVLADGVMPGPLISGQKGDSFQLNVINELHNQSMLQATSIHWHGIFQQGTSWADGPAFVTQCPIMPNSSFLYEFSVPDQAGTFWYHSHYSTQYCDGLRGPFVVYDPNDPFKDMYDVDDDSTVITLSDWYHRPAPSLNDQPPNNRLADSTLINGNGRWDDGTQIVGSLSTISVTPGQSYRFRLVSLSCDPTYNFSIDGHTLTVIETDGVATKPTVVDQIQIFAGQRYSFVLNANQSVDNYWIRAGPVSASSQTDFIGGKNSAILRYVGAPDAEPTTPNVPSTMPLQEWTLEPFVESPPPSVNPEDIHSIQVGFVNGRFAVNNVPFTSPSVDVLLQILSGVQDQNSLMPAGSIIPLAKNRTIELQFSGGGDHPFHLHGHNFWVMQSAGSTVQPTKPILRDVVNIGGNSDNVRVRFQTNNPGPWFLHCHIDWHLEAGLAVILAEDIPGIAQNTNPPPAWEDLCKNFVPEVPNA